MFLVLSLVVINEDSSENNLGTDVPCELNNPLLSHQVPPTFDEFEIN